MNTRNRFWMSFSPCTFRRHVCLGLLLLLVLGGWPTATQPSATVHAARATAPPLVSAVESVGFTVRDMDSSLAFFEDVLGFTLVSDVEVTGEDYEQLQGVFGLRMRVVRLRLGEEQIELTEYLAPRGRPIPADARSNDRSFQHIALITGDLPRAYQWLRQHKVEHVSPGPQRLPDWNKNAGGIQAFYFKDPDGHPLEILQFPAGKGAPKWQTLAQQAAGKLFLGIDHTAMVVSDTAASLKLYRDVLGLQVAGESENYGIEQERLNNVFGAHLQITTLRAPQGPGIELLEYLTPRTGRPAPNDKQANDLLHWQTKLVTTQLTTAYQQVRGNAYNLLSSRVVELVTPVLGFRRSFLFTDPDAHALQLLEH